MKRLLSVAICLGFIGFLPAQGFAGTAESDGQPHARTSNSLLGAYLAGRSARQLRDTEAAAHYFYRAFQLSPEDELLRANALLLLMSDGRMEDAFPLAPDVIDDNPKNGFANIAIAIQAVKQERHSDVVTMVEDAPAGAYNTIIGAMLRAWAYQGTGDSNAALASLSELKGSTVFEFLRDYHSGLVAHQAGRIDEARAYFGDALAVNTSMASRAALAFAASLAGQGDVAKANAMINTGLEREPQSPLLLAARKSLAENGRITMPIATVTDGYAEAFFMVGTILASDRPRGQQPELASVYLNVSRYLKPSFADAQMMQAAVMELTDRWDRALVLYDTISPSSPYVRRAQIRKANALNNLDRDEEAIALLRELSAADPEDRNTMASLGSLLRGKERYAEAATVYARVVALIETPVESDWRIYYQLGVSEERAGKWQEAEAHFLKALELNPEQPLVLNYLGYSWIEKGLNLDRALEMVQRAVDQRPDDGYIIDSLGWAYYQLGKYDLAVKHLERSVAFAATDPTVNDHLGDAYWKSGRKIEAGFQWNHALTFKPEERFLAKIERKIEVGLDIADVEEKASKASAKNGSQSTE